MGATAIVNIGQLVTGQPACGEGDLGVIEDAALVMESGRIAWVGPSCDVPPCDERVDAEGRCAVPGFVDSTGGVPG